MTAVFNDSRYDQFVRDSVYQSSKSFVEQQTIFGFGLTGESGEIAEMIKKFHDRGKPIDSVDMKLELGDVLWYVTAMANLYGLTLNDIADANMAKLIARRASTPKKAGVGG